MAQQDSKGSGDPDPWKGAESSNPSDPWAGSEEIKAPAGKAQQNLEGDWSQTEFGYDRAVRGGRGHRGGTDRGPGRNRGPRGPRGPRGLRANVRFHKDRSHEGGRTEETKGSWEAKGSAWDAQDPAPEAQGTSWEKTEYKPREEGHRDRPRGDRRRSRGGQHQGPRRGDEAGHTDSHTHEHQEGAEDSPTEEHKERKNAGYRGGAKNRRGPKKIVAERTKIRRHRFFENSHRSEVLYREEDEQFDPETHSSQTHFRANREWNELPIPENLLGAIETIGYSYPSKIQNFGIEVILKEGFENLLAQAPNGSGKTATFIVGSLCRIDVADPRTQVICINHTIELANQNFHEYKKFADPCGISVALLSKERGQIEGQVIVTSSGTFLKALRANQIQLEGLKVFVMDEADHLLNRRDNEENFKKIEQFIKNSLPQDKVQILLFSATYSEEIKSDIVRLLGNLNEITIKKEDLMLDTIDHYYFRVEQSHKIDAFNQVLRKITIGISIAFVNTCGFARTVHNVVSKSGFPSALLMGQNMTVDERNLTMQDFNEGRYSTLITTNLLARGIDNTKVKCVINFDLPRIPRSREIDDVLYLHRSGRCSRFGRHGVTISLVTTDEELETLKSLEESYHMEIKEIGAIDDLDEIVGKKEGEEEIKDV